MNAIQALLENETIHKSILDALMFSLIYDGRQTSFSDNDRAAAVSILLIDGRCEVGIDRLDRAIKERLPAVSAVLQEDERIKPLIQKCELCDENIGIYKCVNLIEHNGCPFIQQMTGDDSDSARPPKCCQACIQRNKICSRCDEAFFCSSCAEEQRFLACNNCGDNLCITCNFDQNAPDLTCDDCELFLCISCASTNAADGWVEIEDSVYCPRCFRERQPGPRLHSSRAA